MTETAPDEDLHAPLTGRRLAMGAGAMGASSILKIAIQLAMLPLMARLLGPSEFGLYALALPTVTFLQMLADGGFGNSMAREPESSEIVWSTAFWVLHGFCALLACVVIGWSFILASISHQPRLPAVMTVLTFSFLPLASSILGGARVIRRGLLAAGSLADLAANLLGAVVGVACAFNHAGVWSLVAQYLCTFAGRAILINLIAPRLPTFQLQWGALKPHFAVGGAMVGSKLADFMGRMLESALLNRSLGASALGIYSFSNQASRFLCEALSNPSWASLYVQALHNEQSAVVQSYYKICRFMGMVLFPTTILVSLASSTFVPLLLGHSWLQAAPVISFILPTYAVWVIGTQCSALLYANGRSGLALWVTGAFAIGRVLAVAAAPWVGLQGAAIGVGVANVLGGCAFVVVAARATGSDPRIVARELTGPLVGAIVAGLSCKALMYLLPGTIIMSIGELVVSGLLYVVTLMVIDRPRLTSDIKMLSGMLLAR